MPRDQQLPGRSGPEPEASTSKNGAGIAGSTPPVLHAATGHALQLQNMFLGSSAFLICGGPSLRLHRLELLEQRGVLTMAVNNAATVVRPRLWCSVDDPGHFSDVIWRDPGILKFVPRSHFDKPVLARDESELLVPSGRFVRDMPGVVGFERNDDFHAERWLQEETFNWGNRGDRVDACGQKGSRSVMYVALRLLFYLGVRKLFLLGCDFRMELGKANYAFEQERSAGSVRGNNSSYKILNVRLGCLVPYFREAGLEIQNCTPDSGLTVFPYCRLEEALAQVLACVPQKIVTRGMYDGADVAGNARNVVRARCGPTIIPKDETANMNSHSTGSKDVTAVIVATATSIAGLKRTARAWTRIGGKLGIRAVLLIDERIAPRPHDLDAIASETGLGAVAMPAPVTAAVDGILQVVRTRWCLRIDGRDLERPGFRLPGLACEPPEAGFCGGTAESVLPADISAALDTWWNSGRRRKAAEPSSTSRPAPPEKPLLIDVSWLRSTVRQTPAARPGLTDEILLRYCARRTGRRVGNFAAAAKPVETTLVGDVKAPAVATRKSEELTDAPAAKAGKVCNERQALQKRGFKDYSLGHQRMYTVPISLLQAKGSCYRILDVGCGIGFGLEQMLKADVVEHYLGVEPTAESFQYVQQKFGHHSHVELRNEDWLDVSADALIPADYVFCIEVVEHLEPRSVLPFFKRLAAATKHNLFLSTPDRARNKHGTRTTKEWQAVLAQVGLNSVAINSQWTTLFICEPKS